MPLQSPCGLVSGTFIYILFIQNTLIIKVPAYGFLKFPERLVQSA